MRDACLFLETKYPNQNIVFTTGNHQMNGELALLLSRRKTEIAALNGIFGRNEKPYKGHNKLAKYKQNNKHWQIKSDFARAAIY